MFDARESSSGDCEYLIEVGRTHHLDEEHRYAASVAQIVARATGDRITHHPDLHRHYGRTPEEAIGRAFAEVERVRKPAGRFARAIQNTLLLFDSQLAAVPAGLRTLRPGSRKLVYASDDYLVDVLVQPGSARGGIVMVGQITSAQHPGQVVEGARVLLERGAQAVARATTNRLGEFDLEFEGPVSDLSLTFTLEQRWVVVKLEHLPGMPS